MLEFKISCSCFILICMCKLELVVFLGLLYHLGGPYNALQLQKPMKLVTLSPTIVGFSLRLGSMDMENFVCCPCQKQQESATIQNQIQYYLYNLGCHVAVFLSSCCVAIFVPMQHRVQVIVAFALANL